jgi:hypothetical protein
MMSVEIYDESNTASSLHEAPVDPGYSIANTEVDILSCLKIPGIKRTGFPAVPELSKRLRDA